METLDKDLKSYPTGAHTDRPRTPAATTRRWGLATGLLLLYTVAWLQLQPQFVKRIIQDVDDTAVGTVKWWKCKSPGHLEGAECGYIIVPLDYLNASVGTAKVALGRYRATTQPRKGMVLYNPGGPGGAGKPVATTIGDKFQQVIGTDWDFVGFDPRGIGETEPRVNCFGSPEVQQIFISNTVLDRGFDVAPNLTDPRTRDHLIIQQREAQSLYKTQFELCRKNMGDTIKYMGSTTVSRDINFITTALEGKDALINYYGGSYGSILGMYLVNMFPDRVGRVVIDGIADTPAWSSTPSYTWYQQWLGNTEDAFKLFIDRCFKAGPEICALAQSKDKGASDIEQRLEAFIGGLYSKPIAVPRVGRPMTLTSGRARISVLWALESPRTWPAVALAFSRAMQGDGSSLLDLPKFAARDLSRSAVSCNDNAPFPAPSAEEVIDQGLDLLMNVQRHTGLAVVTTEPDSGCEFWPVTPPERFQGPWNHTLRNPILVHSNTADPVTPIDSGRRVKKLLGNSSSLAIQDGPGHTSFSLSSLCTVKITQNYFKSGKLPPDGHICPVDESPFPQHVEAVRVYSDEDALLLSRMKVLGKYMDRMH